MTKIYKIILNKVYNPTIDQVNKLRTLIQHNKKNYINLDQVNLTSIYLYSIHN